MPFFLATVDRVEGTSQRALTMSEMTDEVAATVYAAELANTTSDGRGNSSLERAKPMATIDDDDGPAGSVDRATAATPSLGHSAEPSVSLAALPRPPSVAGPTPIDNLPARHARRDLVPRGAQPVEVEVLDSEVPAPVTIARVTERRQGDVRVIETTFNVPEGHGTIVLNGDQAKVVQQIVVHKAPRVLRQALAIGAGLFRKAKRLFGF
jgi:hypothetical protein